MSRSPPVRSAPVAGMNVIVPLTVAPLEKATVPRSGSRFTPLLLQPVNAIVNVASKHQFA